MNIFVLDNDPIIAATYQCDKHVVKMVLESAQMLCTAVSGLSFISTPYKATHKMHPCVRWTMESKANFLWLVDHSIALADEYRFRYGKVHKSLSVIEWAQTNVPVFSTDCHTQFALAMPDRYKTSDVVESYRRYYVGEKSTIAKWKKGRHPPEWFSESILENMIACSL